MERLRDRRRGVHLPAPSSSPESELDPGPPLPLAGGDRGVGARYRLGRPTRLARLLRGDATPQERKLWSYLRGSQLSGHKFSRQLPIAGYVCDFVCRGAKLVVEVDGGQHSWRVDEDAERTAAIQRLDFRVLRVWNNEVQENIEGVLAVIERELLSGSPPPAPSRMREGET